jgi:hypothetical protein
VNKKIDISLAVLNADGVCAHFCTARILVSAQETLKRKEEEKLSHLYTIKFIYNLVKATIDAQPKKQKSSLCD